MESLNKSTDNKVGATDDEILVYLWFDENIIISTRLFHFFFTVQSRVENQTFIHLELRISIHEIHRVNQGSLKCSILY